MRNLFTGLLVGDAKPFPVVILPDKSRFTSLLDSLDDCVNDDRLACTGDGLKVIPKIDCHQDTESAIRDILQPVLSATTNLLMKIVG